VPQAPSGKLDLLTCRTVVRTRLRSHRRLRVTSWQCSAQNFSGTITSNGKNNAKLVRGGVTYAVGTVLRKGNRVLVLMLTDRRRLTHGRYVIVLTQRQGHVSPTKRIQINLG
jgi:hypothetical protein